MAHKDDICNICYDSLSIGKIKSKCCGVCYHYECLQEYLNYLLVPGSRLSINDCGRLRCLNCGNPMKSQYAERLINQANNVLGKAKDIVLELVRSEVRSKEKSMCDNEAVRYGKRLYQIYICYSCKDPYFFRYTNKFDYVFSDEQEEDTAPMRKEAICGKCQITRHLSMQDDDLKKEEQPLDYLLFQKN